MCNYTNTLKVLFYLTFFTDVWQDGVTSLVGPPVLVVSVGACRHAGHGELSREGIREPVG